MYYSSATLYYKVLLHYYSIYTRKYYASTSLYYKVLKYTTPLLLCTTKDYTSTIFYYKVLQHTTPVLQQYYSVLLSTKRHFQCGEQKQAPYNLTKYCACLAKCKSLMICVTYETLFPMCAATRGSLKLHQLLRLPHKMNVTSDLPHISKVISNTRSKCNNPPTLPNATPAFFCSVLLRCDLLTKKVPGRAPTVSIS